MNKLNNKGFLSVTTIISFVLVFITILVLIMVTYTNNRKIFNIYKSDIKDVLLDKRKVNKELSSLFESPNESPILPGKSYDYLVSDNVKSISYSTSSELSIKYVDPSGNDQTYTSNTVNYFSIKDYIHNKKFIQNQNKLLQIYKINNEGNYTFDEDNYYIEELNETFKDREDKNTYTYNVSFYDKTSYSLKYIIITRTEDTSNNTNNFACTWANEYWTPKTDLCSYQNDIGDLFVEYTDEVQE